MKTVLSVLVALVIFAFFHWIVDSLTGHDTNVWQTPEAYHRVIEFIAGATTTRICMVRKK